MKKIKNKLLYYFQNLSLALNYVFVKNFSEIEVIKGSLDNSSVVFDIGSNLGTFIKFVSKFNKDKEISFYSFEPIEELIEFQKKYFDKSPYKNKIIQHLGKAESLVKKMDGNFDLIFIDADKTNYLNYYKTLVPKLNKNGLIIADNVLWSGKVLDKENDDPDTIALKKFNQWVKEDKRVDTIILEIRDGLTLCRKI